MVSFNLTIVLFGAKTKVKYRDATPIIRFNDLKVTMNTETNETKKGCIQSLHNVLSSTVYMVFFKRNSETLVVVAFPYLSFINQFWEDWGGESTDTIKMQYIPF